MIDNDAAPIPSAPVSMSQADAFELAALRREEKARQTARQLELEYRVQALEDQIASMNAQAAPSPASANSDTDTTDSGNAQAGAVKSAGVSGGKAEPVVKSGPGAKANPGPRTVGAMKWL